MELSKEIEKYYFFPFALAIFSIFKNFMQVNPDNEDINPANPTNNLESYQ